MMVTSGEHHGTLQSFRTLSETGIDIMRRRRLVRRQPPVEIAAIAKARGQLVVPTARRFTHIMR